MSFDWKGFISLDSSGAEQGAARAGGAMRNLGQAVSGLQRTWSGLANVMAGNTMLGAIDMFQGVRMAITAIPHPLAKIAVALVAVGGALLAKRYLDERRAAAELTKGLNELAESQKKLAEARAKTVFDRMTEDQQENVLRGEEGLLRNELRSRLNSTRIDERKRVIEIEQRLDEIEEWRYKRARKRQEEETIRLKQLAEAREKAMFDRVAAEQESAGKADEAFIATLDPQTQAKVLRAKAAGSRDMADVESGGNDAARIRAAQYRMDAIEFERRAMELDEQVQKERADLVDDILGKLVDDANQWVDKQTKDAEDAKQKKSAARAEWAGGISENWEDWTRSRLGAEAGAPGRYKMAGSLFGMLDLAGVRLGLGNNPHRLGGKLGDQATVTRDRKEELAADQLTELRKITDRLQRALGLG
jgi:hypothetical protein